jgi:8-oxo-dGTP pyrophosphatase MutT (NUDIX family)
MTETETSSGMVDAATCVVFRRAGEGVEVLLLQRPSGGSFAGAWVFPGGRIDESDGSPSVSEAERARAAAVRETREECGLEIDPASLILISQWIPPVEAPRRFRTWFFIGEASSGEVRVDGAEILDAIWISPAQAIAAHDAATLELAPPTWLTLKFLADRPDPAGGWEVEIFETHIHRGETGETYLVWSPDEKHIGSRPVQPGYHHRLNVSGRPWIYSRSPEPRWTQDIPGEKVVDQ